MTQQSAQGSLVICATLVQNPMNLGGLCRTCEVLGVEKLVLSDLALANAWAFRKIAASAQAWQVMEACKPEGLAEWLLDQKGQGYTLIALTLGAQSYPLHTYTFPPKVVLVLGQELTGIPVPIQTLCDHAVAIAQVGHLNSLNVQTAAAIAIYEYCRQHLDNGNIGSG
jgi:tRNA guanosine-2'-O-methyltransferase